MFKKERYVIKEENDCAILQFESLLNFNDKFTHCFTTRIGGSSKGNLSSMNFGLLCGDNKANVENNTNKILKILDIEDVPYFRTKQTHSNNVLSLNNLNCIPDTDVDGLTVCDTQATLIAIFADCVPVFMYDPVNKCIGIVHSGWKGTVNEIIKNGLQIFIDEYGCKIENIKVVVGPSIGGCCFAVKNDVSDVFFDKLPKSKQFIKRKADSYYIDLKSIICMSAVDFGISHANISYVDLCTSCRQDLFYSHRGSGGKTGRMAAFVSII